MGDWDAPAPWYVYTFGGLALAWLGCLGSDQWRWALYTGLALAANALLLVWVYWAKKNWPHKREPEPKPKPDGGQIHA